MPHDRVLSFGPFRLDAADARLWRETQPVRLTAKALQVLSYLAERPGQLVTKDELFGAVWPDTVVSDATLASNIQAVRQALGDDPRRPQYLETVHRRGFRFIAPIAAADAPGRRAELPVPSAQALPLPEKPSIIVLPFVNMSLDPEQEYFSDGLTDVLTGDLSMLSSLFVVARNSAFTYKGKAVKVQDVGREMEVRYVLEGSVQKAEGQVRITAQLIEAATGGYLWAERYDRPLQNIFALQDEIVQQIVTTLKPQLTLQEQGYIVRKHTDNLEAYDAFLRGLEYFERITKESNAQARQLFEKAVALDPQYAEAYAYLSWTDYREWGVRWSMDPQTLERAVALGQQAVALDDSLPIAHSVLGEAYALQQQYNQALAEGARAIALNPNNVHSYALQVELLTIAGRPEDALRAVAQARRLNPRYSPLYVWELGVAYFWTGRYAEAIATLKELISRSPHVTAYLVLASSYLWQWVSQQSPAAQTLEPALAAIQQALALNDSLHWNHTALGNIALYQSSMSRPWRRWSEPWLSLPPTRRAMRIWLWC